MNRKQPVSKANFKRPPTGLAYSDLSEGSTTAKRGCVTKKPASLACQPGNAALSWPRSFRAAWRNRKGNSAVAQRGSDKNKGPTVERLDGSCDPGIVQPSIVLGIRLPEKSRFASCFFR